MITGIKKKQRKKKLVCDKIFLCSSKIKMNQGKTQITKVSILAVPVRAGLPDSFTFACRCRWRCCKMDSDVLCLARLRHRTGYNSTGKTCQEETSRSTFAKLSFSCVCVNPFGSYPKSPSPAHTSQVSRPGAAWVLVITVCRQWGHKVWPGTSCRDGVTTTCVTGE